ncbi:MAG: hypothetical protein AB8U69_03205 [Anaplasma ovis]
MPNSRGVAYSVQDISRRFALFMPGKGIVRFGRLIPGVTPTSELINRDSEGEALPVSSSAAYNDVLLSRTFCFFNSNPANVRRVVALLASSGLVVRIMCSAQDREYLTERGISRETCISDARYAFPSRDSIALIYHREFSRMDFRGLKALMVWESAPQEMRQLLTELMAGTHGVERVTGVDNKFFTARYRASRKPVGQKLLDSALYMEKWSLLSTEEKTLRCAFSALLTLMLPIMPVVFALIARGRSKDPSHNLGIMRWQNSIYRDEQRPKSNPYDMLFGGDTEATSRLTDIVNRIASEPSFGYMDSDHRLTEKATAVSKRHNLLLLASRKQLSRGELALRAAFLAVLATLTIASIVQLSLGSIAHPGASIASAISYCALIGICAGSIYIHRKDTKRLLMFGTLSFVCLTLLVNSIAAFHIGGTPGPIAQGLETMISAALIALFVVYCTVVCAANLIYKKDKMVANELGMSFTAYREIKPQLCSELKNHDRNAASAEVLVRILEDSGEDVTTLLERQAESATPVESREAQQQHTGSGASPATESWLEPTNPFAADIEAEQREERIRTGATGENGPNISSSLQDVTATTKGRAHSSPPDVGRPARSA